MIQNIDNLIIILTNFAKDARIRKDYKVNYFKKLATIINTFVE